jgi:hypothetical protein
VYHVLYEMMMVAMSRAEVIDLIQSGNDPNVKRNAADDRRRV